jgi:chromosome segregation ATPase
MTIKTIAELKEEIGLLPVHYKQALEKQTQTILEVNRLEQEIAKLRKTLTSENKTDEAEFIDENDDTELINLKRDLEKLKLNLTRTEYSVELNSRKENPKATESHVKALIGIDEEVYNLRERFIEEQAKIKTRESELRRQRQERREKDRLTYRHSRDIPENQELENLETKLFTAKSEQYSANDEVEVLKVKLETYRLLVGLESLEETE